MTERWGYKEKSGCLVLWRCFLWGKNQKNLTSGSDYGNKEGSTKGEWVGLAPSLFLNKVFVILSVSEESRTK